MGSRYRRALRSGERRGSRDLPIHSHRGRHVHRLVQSQGRGRSCCVHQLLSLGDRQGLDSLERRKPVQDGPDPGQDALLRRGHSHDPRRSAIHRRRGVDYGGAGGLDRAAADAGQRGRHIPQVQDHRGIRAERVRVDGAGAWPQCAAGRDRGSRSANVACGICRAARHAGGETPGRGGEAAARRIPPGRQRPRADPRPRRRREGPSQ